MSESPNQSEAIRTLGPLIGAVLSALTLVMATSCTVPDAAMVAPETLDPGQTETVASSSVTLGPPTNIHYNGFFNGQHEIWWNKPTGPGFFESVKYIIEIRSLVDWSVAFEGERNGNVSLFFLFINDLPVGPYLIYVEAEWNGQASLGIAEFTVTEGPTPPTAPDPPGLSVAPHPVIPWQKSPYLDNLCAQTTRVSVYTDGNNYPWEMRYREGGRGAWTEESGGHNVIRTIPLLPSRRYVIQARQFRDGEGTNDVYSEWAEERIYVEADVGAVSQCGSAPSITRLYSWKSGGRVSMSWEVDHNGWEVDRVSYGPLDWPHEAFRTHGRHQPCQSGGSWTVTIGKEPNHRTLIHRSKWPWLDYWHHSATQNGDRFEGRTPIQDRLKWIGVAPVSIAGRGACVVHETGQPAVTP